MRVRVDQPGQDRDVAEVLDGAAVVRADGRSCAASTVTMPPAIGGRLIGRTQAARYAVTTDERAQTTTDDTDEHGSFCFTVFVRVIRGVETVFIVRMTMSVTRSFFSAALRAA